MSTRIERDSAKKRGGGKIQHVQTSEIIIMPYPLLLALPRSGAASGFGLATTKQLIGKGCFVIAVDINEEALEKNFGSNKDSVTTFHCT